MNKLELYTSSKAGLKGKKCFNTKIVNENLDYLCFVKVFDLYGLYETYIYATEKVNTEIHITLTLFKDFLRVNNLNADCLSLSKFIANSVCKENAISIGNHVEFKNTDRIIKLSISRDFENIKSITIIQ